LARIRSLKPEYWADQKLARCSRDARLLYLALWNFADEQARMVGDPRQVKGLCFALDDDIAPADIDRLLGELAALGRLVRYEVGGERYLFLPKLAKHQRLDARQPSRYPPPPEQATPPPENPVPPAPTDFPAEVVGESEQVDVPHARGRSRLQVAGSRLQGSASPHVALAIAEPPAETAQTVLGAYIDWRRSRGVNGIDGRTKGMLARQLREAFDGGHPPEIIRLGLADWDASDTHPSALGSFIDTRARGGQARASPGKAQRQLDDIQRTYQQMQAMNPEGGERNGDLATVDRDRRQTQRELP